MRREGLGAAMTALERLGQADETVRRDGHLYAHSLGLAAYRGDDRTGAVFAQCSPIFQSGCYHGVIQAHFAALPSSGIDSTAVNALCRSYRDDPSARWLLFQCAHGMGHGLTLFHGHHLPSALQGCDLVADPWEREGCYGGAFMENVVQATAPHHTVGRPQAAGAEDDHAHHHAGAAAEATRPAFKPLDPADPLYPCSALGERYQHACYQMQTSPILFFNRGNFAATGRACMTAPEAHRAACFQSLGRDASSYTGQDHARALRICTDVDADYRSWCHVGYAKNLVDLTASATDGLTYCRLILDAEGKRACYEAVGEEIWVLSDDRVRRREWCEAAEPGFREVCARAAGVAGSSAPAL